MKWQKVYRIYIVSEDGLLKKPVDVWGYHVFQECYYTLAEAEKDLINKSVGENINHLPDNLHVIPAYIKVLE